jgi:hypothetical protein
MVTPTTTEDPVSLGEIVSVELSLLLEVLDKVVAMLESKGPELPAETVVVVDEPLTTLKDGVLGPEGTVIFEMGDAGLELGVTVTLGP